MVGPIKCQTRSRFQAHRTGKYHRRYVHRTICIIRRWHLRNLRQHPQFAMRDDQFVRHNPQFVCRFYCFAIQRRGYFTTSTVATIARSCPLPMKSTHSRNDCSIACRCPRSTTSKPKLQQYPLVTLLLRSLTSQINSFVDLLPTSHDVGCYRCCCFSAVSHTRDSSPVSYFLVELSKFRPACVCLSHPRRSILYKASNCS